MAAYSTTYLALLKEAAAAVGLVLEQLSTDDNTVLRGVPNQAVLDVCSQRDWPFLRKSGTVTFAGGERSKSLPSDWVKFPRDAVIRFALGSGFAVLRPCGLDWIEAMRAAADVSGVPEVYALGTYDATSKVPTLEIHPKSDGSRTFTLTYIRTPEAMVGDTDVPDLPTTLTNAIITATRIRARQAFNQEVAREWKNELQEEIADAWRLVGNPEPNNSRQLADVVHGGRLSGYERGIDVTLSSVWPDSEVR